MTKFRKLALLAAIAGLAAYQGRQLHIYAATGQAPATTQNAGPSHGADTTHPSDAAASPPAVPCFSRIAPFVTAATPGAGKRVPTSPVPSWSPQTWAETKSGMSCCTGAPTRGCRLSNSRVSRSRTSPPSFTCNRPKPWRKTASAKVWMYRIYKPGMWRQEGLLQWPGRLCHLPFPHRRPGRNRQPLRGAAAGGANAVPQGRKEQGDGDPAFGRNGCRHARVLDEFTVGLRDATGTYRSWRVSDVKVKVDAPVEAHVALFSKYTDADIHNLMAYIQTLR